MARGNRTNFDPCNDVTIYCNHCSKSFNGRDDFVRRMLKKHLILKHCFTEQLSNEEVNKYVISEYTIRSNSRRNFQTNFENTDSDTLLELELKRLMKQ